MMTCPNFEPPEIPYVPTTVPLDASHGGRSGDGIALILCLNESLYQYVLSHVLYTASLNVH